MAGIPQVITEDRASGAQFIDGSLRFDSGKSQYLKRTPTAAGNRKKNTVSFWVKRSSFGDNYQRIFNCDTGAQALHEIVFNNESSPNQDNLVSEVYIGGQSRIRTNAVLRDTGWYHIVVVYDSLNSTQADRQIIYINGERQSINNSVGVGQIDGMFSSANEHRIGNGKNYEVPFNGSLSQFYFLDGIAAGPEEFGYTDPLTNTWRPKKYDGAFTKSSPNNGTNWTQSLSATSGTLSNGSYAFDGDLSTRAQTANAAAGKELTFAPPAINFTTSLEVYCDQGSNVPTATWNGNTVNPGLGAWVTVYSGSGELSSTYPLVINTESAAQYATLKGVRIDGEILIDNLNDTGINSFYLPMDGNSPIGEDKSGVVTLNDGTIWSNSLTSNVNLNLAASRAFDGDATNSTLAATSNATNANLLFTKTFNNVFKLRVYMDHATNYRVRVNGGTWHSDSSLGAGSNASWRDLTSIIPSGGTITSIESDTNGANNGVNWSAVEVNGQILVDGLKGNSWKPVNFAGSVTPDNPTADGALSILKPYKPGGVRTDSKTYTVTASGGNYYLDGALKPTLDVLRGGSYTFDYTGATSHPFYLSSLQDGSHNSKAYSSRLYRSGGYLDLGTGHTDLQPGSGDFCIELYVNLVNQGANFPVFVDTRVSGSGDTNGFFWGIRDSDNRIYLYTHSGTQIYADHSLTTGKWYHLALTRQSGTFRMFIDGSQAGVSYSQSQNYTNQIRYIGNSTNSEAQTWYIDAYISNFRFVKGEAVYTTNFTPPQTTLTTTSQGVNSSNVKLLCCQDSSPTTAVVSPGTITLGQAGSDAVTSVNTHNPFLYNSVHGNFGVNTATSNTTKITIPNYAADTLYYYCSAHSGMGSSINVTTDSFKADPYAWKCVVAAPLDKNLDYSDEINVNSSAKTVASFEGSQAYVSNTNFYRSALDLGAASARNSTSISSSNDYFFGLSPWTVEVWAYRTSNTSNSNYMPLWEITGDSGLGVGWLAFLGAEAGVNRFFYGYGSTHTSVTWGLSPINQWVHNAVVFDGQYLMVFEDGFCKNRTAYSSLSGPPAYFGRAAQMNLGTQNYSNDGNDRNFAGYVQDFRVYKGVAKYTASAVGDHSYTPASSNPDILSDTPSGVAYGSELTKITDGAVAFDGNGDYLSLASTSDFGFGTGDFTVECFVYYNDTSLSLDYIFDFRTVGDASEARMALYPTGAGSTLDLYVSGGNLISAGSFRISAWNHVAVVRNSGTTTLYLNGISIGSASDSTDYADAPLQIGQRQGYAAQSWYGQISNFRVIKGTALYTSDFTPPTEPLTEVTNTTLLCCQSTTSATEAAVTPGTITANGNVVATNFNPFADDINAIRGQETGYATLNPLAKYGGTLSNGNLTMTGGNDIPSTIGVSSGKWYAEATITNIAATLIHIGVVATGTKSFGISAGDGHVLNNMDYLMIRTDSAGPFNAAGRGAIASWSQVSDTGATFTTGDIMSIELDMDNLFVKFYKNRVLRTHFTFTLASTFDKMFFYNRNNGSGVSTWNFGQKPFKFPPSDGFQPLNLSNVQPEKVIARPDKYVDVSLWSGNGTSQTISGLKHKPDFVWLKKRSGGTVRSHQLFDSVRGVHKSLHSDSTNGEDTNTGRLTAFNQDGFAVGGDDGANGSGGTFVGWTWKAGGNKNTYNIDDVGYANSSDVGMAVGDQNSSAYDTSDTWSDDLSSPNGAYGGSSVANAFNGSLSNGFEAGNPSGNYSTIRFQPASAITVNTKIRIYVFDLNDSNVTYQYRVNDGSWTSMPGTSSPYLRWQDLGFTGTLNSFEYRSNTSSTYKPTLYAVEIDGKMLVDSGTDLSGLTQYPSITASGCSVGTSII